MIVTTFQSTTSRGLRSQEKAEHTHVDTAFLSVFRTTAMVWSYFPKFYLFVCLFQMLLHYIKKIIIIIILARLVSQEEKHSPVPDARRYMASALPSASAPQSSHPAPAVVAASSLRTWRRCRFQPEGRALAATLRLRLIPLGPRPRCL